MKKIIADLHSHSIASYDSCNRINWIIRRCEKVGINCLAVTDHDRIDGALALKDTAPFHIIVGEEIDTGEGEIIGLFLKSWIPPTQGLRNTIVEIKKQGGLVYLPHPLSVSRKNFLKTEELVKYSEHIDIVEIFNSRTRFESENRQWLDDLLASGNVVKAAGSDAHSPCELGNVRIEMDRFTSTDDFLSSLNESSFYLKKSPILFRILMNQYVRKALRYIS